MGGRVGGAAAREDARFLQAANVSAVTCAAACVQQSKALIERGNQP
jgi:hypothetical protein